MNLVAPGVPQDLGLELRLLCSLALRFLLGLELRLLLGLDTRRLLGLDTSRLLGLDTLRIGLDPSEVCTKSSNSSISRTI